MSPACISCGAKCNVLYMESIQQIFMEWEVHWWEFSSLEFIPVSVYVSDHCFRVLEFKSVAAQMPFLKLCVRETTGMAAMFFPSVTVDPRIWLSLKVMLNSSLKRTQEWVCCESIGQPHLEFICRVSPWPSRYNPKEKWRAGRKEPV